MKSRIRLISLNNTLVVIQPDTQPFDRPYDPRVPIAHVGIELKQRFLNGDEFLHRTPDAQSIASQDLAVGITRRRHCHKHLDENGERVAHRWAKAQGRLGEDCAGLHLENDWTGKVVDSDPHGQIRRSEEYLVRGCVQYRLVDKDGDLHSPETKLDVVCERSGAQFVEIAVDLRSCDRSEIGVNVVEGMAVAEIEGTGNLGMKPDRMEHL
ncbi:hypothetical protein HG530_003726 [Fusarium avenaceum]|nr:hypothetical protein HG530_003726 [Fusarium avenaceum]